LSLVDDLRAAKANLKLAGRLYGAVTSVRVDGLNHLEALRAVQDALPDGYRTISQFEADARHWSLKRAYQVLDRAINAALASTKIEDTPSHD
jgi:hypothetical protein